MSKCRFKYCQDSTQPDTQKDRQTGRNVIVHKHAHEREQTEMKRVRVQRFSVGLSNDFWIADFENGMTEMVWHLKCGFSVVFGAFSWSILYTVYYAPFACFLSSHLS